MKERGRASAKPRSRRPGERKSVARAADRSARGRCGARAEAARPAQEHRQGNDAMQVNPHIHRRIRRIGFDVARGLHKSSSP
jgi:hypothetical protein